MDRRVLKSRKAILEAFESLLTEKSYEEILVKDILNRADVSRATFYSHFESKETLLEEVSFLLFQHVFEEPTSQASLEGLIHHLLYHLNENAVMKDWLVKGQSILVFEFQHRIEDYFWPFVEANWCKKHPLLPVSYLKKQMVSNMMTSIRWWLKDHPTLTMEEMTTMMVEYLI